MISLFHWFVKITGWIPQLLVFRIKTYYEDKSVQGKRIRGKAIVVANHRSLFDVGLMMMLFWRRTLRCVVAEVIYTKNLFVRAFIRMMGAIKVDRDSHDFGFLGKCKRILDKGGVVEIYPEARLPRAGEQLPLEFKPSAVYLALESGAPIIPVYHNGNHFSKKRCEMIIGTPFNARELYDESLSEKENISIITEKLRGKIIELREELERQRKKA